jgi:Na+/proline symporter
MISNLDWTVLLLTLLFIVGYGAWKTRGSKNIDSYLLGDQQMRWWTVGLSIMATQASAITFLSAPGQAYTDGMRFVQFYFGLPIAMVVLSVTVVPIYHRLKVYTAYEYLENRFDLKTRILAAFLFLTQRGLAAGFTIFAPSLILSALLGWNIYYTNLIIGILVIVYTVSGGTKAVALTQKYQMAVIFIGMALAGIMVVQLLPQDVSFNDALHIAGKSGKLNAIDLDFDLSSRYNIWSGLIGGFFLALSYFGTDQSQVARYLTGKSVAESRLGLLMNGLVKVPMQFAILFIGAMVYVFYIFYTPPVFFNKVVEDNIKNSSLKFEYAEVEDAYFKSFELQKEKAYQLLDALKEKNDREITEASEALQAAKELSEIKKDEARQIILEDNPLADTNDTNFIFLTFVLNHLPAGLIGLIIAVIFSASMSSTSSELNALASTTVVDVYKRMFKKDGSDKHYVHASKWFTLAWGIYAILFAMFANRLGTLIEAVNILGSLVYGTILGIFLVAFYFKNIGARNTFIAAVLSEMIILYCFFFTDIPYLWYNVIGSLNVILFAWMITKIQSEKAV